MTPHFSVLDEREQALLRRDAFDATVARAAEDGDGVLGKALAKIVGLTSGDYYPPGDRYRAGKPAELHAWSPIRAASRLGRGGMRALKRLFGVAEAD